jgi:hypothetical protein
MVRVVFRDADSGESLGFSEMPSGLLPESFEARTTVQIQGQDWEVVSAVPMTRPECERRGELHLSLRRITVGTVSLKDVLYSLPTICDEIPPIAPGTSKLGKPVLELHEDDWRQVEFVALAQQAQIDACLAQIHRIWTEERTESGFFRQLHLRTEIPRPLAGRRLLLTELRSAFDRPRWLDGIAYRDVAGLVAGGFACESASGIRLYGLAQDDVVTVLGLISGTGSAAREQDSRALAALMRAQELCLIDWCRLQQVPASDAALAEYLQS